MKAGDIISNNWIEFLERELKRGEEVLNGVVAPILVEFDALGISEFSLLFFFLVLPFPFCSSFPSLVAIGNLTPVHIGCPESDPPLP